MMESARAVGNPHWRKYGVPDAAHQLVSYSRRGLALGDFASILNLNVEFDVLCQAWSGEIT